MFTALLFELFLAILFVVTAFLFFNHGLDPSLGFYISGLVLILMLCLTVSILASVIGKIKLCIKSF